MNMFIAQKQIKTELSSCALQISNVLNVENSFEIQSTLHNPDRFYPDFVYSGQNC